jgi:predicted nucleotidyltransferase
MRLTSEQIATILDTTHAVAGAQASVWLFGSRLDDARRGGDVDLLIESAPPVGLLQRARIKVTLEQKLNLPVDIVAMAPHGPVSPFVTLARAHARQLNFRPVKASAE